MSLLRRIADPEDFNSFATRLRRKRFSIFKRLLESIPPPLRILDVGGTESFWKMVEFNRGEEIQITLLNLSKSGTALKNVTSVAGDACRMTQFENKSFDVVFSNSVIEHLGTYGNQREMSKEVRRVGKRYFVQTPNKFFPMEPHFLFPFFQFLPFRAQVWIASHSKAGWYCRPDDPVAAAKEVKAIRLLTETELQGLFPDGVLYKEKFCGLTKSFIIYNWWNHPGDR